MLPQLVSSLVILASSLCLSPATAARRFARSPSLSIINPNYTDISNYPYTVAVLKDNELLGGGVLLNRRWVLTAAYNTDGFWPSDIKVRIGSNSPSSGGRVYRVTNITQHPQYIGNWTYDLSLLKLKAPVNISLGRPVHALASGPFTGSAAAVVTGYGATASLSELRGVGLQVADIEVYDFSTCDKDWYGSELSAGEICGYAPGVGPCWSDFGEPMTVCHGSAQSCTLVAIFAGSYGCADDHFPGIYMDVGYFHDWITGIINGK